MTKTRRMKKLPTKVVPADTVPDLIDELKQDNLKLRRRITTQGKKLDELLIATTKKKEKKA